LNSAGTWSGARCRAPAIVMSSDPHATMYGFGDDLKERPSQFSLRDGDWNLELRQLRARDRADGGGFNCRGRVRALSRCMTFNSAGRASKAPDSPLIQSTNSLVASEVLPALRRHWRSRSLAFLAGQLLIGRIGEDRWQRRLVDEDATH